MRRIAAYLKSKRGFVLLFVLCVMTLLFAFGGAMLIASSSALGSVDKLISQEQAYQDAYGCCSAAVALLTSEEGNGLKTAARGVTATSPATASFSLDGEGIAECELTLKDGVLTVSVTSSGETPYTMGAALRKTGTGAGATFAFIKYTDGMGR